MVKTTYISVMLIWSTTPLAIQWSIESGMLFGLMSRMSLGLVVLGVLFAVSRQKLIFNMQACVAYLAAGLGIYFAMSLVYWSAQYIPSGWISVIFGLSPIFTGVASIVLLDENHFTKYKTLGMVLGIIGLIVIFHTSAAMGIHSIFGVLAMLMSTVAHATSAVILKKINAPITGTQSTFGGLLVAVPLIMVTFLLSGESVGNFTTRPVLSILYLGAIATAAGFSMYYYILNKLNAVKVSLIALITPVCALLLGSYLNNEPLSVSIFVGGGLILFGLALFELPANKSSSKLCAGNELNCKSCKAS